MNSLSSSSGLNYATQGKLPPVCKPGEFPFAATYLEHGHIYGQCDGLIEAGGELRWVYDSDPRRVDVFCKKYPQVRPASSFESILDDPEIKLVTAAAIPNQRGPLGCRVMEAGKDYFTDKAPFTTLEQLEMARQVAAKTSSKYMVYYSERLHVECAVLAGLLVEQGAIGRVLQTIGTGPHRLSLDSRPEWFFDHEQTGGILCDLGCHQCEQFLFFTGSTDARINFSAVANYHNPAHPGLEDFGETSLTGNSGASGYYRVDWFTPDGLRSWGDGRLMILGTTGYIELRKYIEIGAASPQGDQLYLVDEKGEHRISCSGQIGYPFFGQLILDCLNRTEKAMTQAHAFKAAELCLKSQMSAMRLD